MRTPDNGSYVSGPVTLSWDVVPGATKYRYKIGITETFGGVDWVEVVPNSVVVSIGLGVHYWKIQQFNGFEWSADSAVWTFTHTAPPVPVLISPPDGGSVSGYVTFAWSPVVGAVKYMVMWSLDPAFAVFESEETPSTSYSTSSRMGVGTWYWKVRSSDGTNWSD